MALEIIKYKYVFLNKLNNKCNFFIEQRWNMFSTLLCEEKYINAVK